MEIVIKPDPEQVADEAFAIVAAAARAKPTVAVGLATGKSPLGLYRRMQGAADLFRRACFFNLDEFVGLDSGHPASFQRFLRENLLDGLGVPAENVRLLRGDAPDLEAECEEYETAIRSVGGIDLQILGLGRNGHIAFNEPGSSLGSRTRVKTLDLGSVADYAGSFPSRDAVPRFSLTMGVGTIMEARRLLVVATGAAKAEIVQRMVEGPVTAEVPGSALQFHARATVALDEEAASKLARRDYWTWVAANKWRVGQK